MLKQVFQFLQTQLIVINELGDEFCRGAFEVAFQQLVGAFPAIFGFGYARLVAIVSALYVDLDKTFVGEDLQQCGDRIRMGFGFRRLFEDVFQEPFAELPEHHHYLFFGFGQWFACYHCRLSF